MFKITGQMKVIAVAKNQADLDGFKVNASSGGVDLADLAKTHGLSLEANEKVLYMRCRLLGYDVPNGNGDAIPRVYAANFGSSFINKQLNVNHEPTPEKIIGKILTTYHTEAPIELNAADERVIGKNVLNGLEDAEVNELQLEGICMIDRTSTLGNDIANKLISGTLSMVSQEASTEYAQCSVCSHKLAGPFDSICAHLDHGSLMVQAYAVEGKKHKVLAYKIHQNPVGTGLAVVTVGAYAKADVLEMVANLEKKSITAEDALGALELQARMYGDSPLIADARLAVTASMNKLNQASVLTAALKKLDGVETEALMKHFGKVTAEEEMKPLPQKASDTSEDVTLDKEAAPQAEDATMSVSTTETGESLGITKDPTPADMPAAIAEAEKEAKSYAKEAQEGGDATEDGGSAPEAGGSSGGGAPKISVSPKVSAMFFRQPVLSASYWAVMDDGKVVTRVTLGALSGGDLTKKVRAGATAISLADHLSSEGYAKDILAHVAKRGLEAVLGEFAAAEKSFKVKADQESEEKYDKGTKSYNSWLSRAKKKLAEKAASEAMDNVAKSVDTKKLGKVMEKQMKRGKRGLKASGRIDHSNFGPGQTWWGVAVSDPTNDADLQDMETVAEFATAQEAIAYYKQHASSGDTIDKWEKGKDGLPVVIKTYEGYSEIPAEELNASARRSLRRLMGSSFKEDVLKELNSMARLGHDSARKAFLAVQQGRYDQDIAEAEQTAAGIGETASMLGDLEASLKGGEATLRQGNNKPLGREEHYHGVGSDSLRHSHPGYVKNHKHEEEKNHLNREAWREGEGVQAAAPVTVTSYDSVVTEESAEDGDVDHELSDGPEDGDVTTFDESDLDEDGSTSKAVAEYLKREGVSEASSSDFHPGVWYETEAYQDYKSGNYTTTSYHIGGLTDEQQQEVFTMLGFGPKVKGAVPAKFWKGKNAPSNNPAEPPLSSAVQVVPDSPGVTRTHGSLKPGGAFLIARKKK